MWVSWSSYHDWGRIFAGIRVVAGEEVTWRRSWTHIDVDGLLAFLVEL